MPSAVTSSKVEKLLNEIQQQLVGVTDKSYFGELRRLIHSPGWTTVAESALVHGLLESMLLTSKQLKRQYEVLMAGARQVGHNEARN